MGPRRAIISVSDKTGLDILGPGLAAQGFELVSTGGTYRALLKLGLSVTEVSEITGVPEMMDGRVKTLHPGIHAGILARLNNQGDRKALKDNGFDLFDVVVVNLYPFEQKAADTNTPFGELIENIDIGGPSLIRAAAKNWERVWVITSPGLYKDLLESLARTDDPSEQLAERFIFMRMAFDYTAAYDRAIANELMDHASFLNGTAMRVFDARSPDDTATQEDHPIHPS